MEVHTPRLTKMMEFFAVGGPSTAPPLAAVPKPTTSPLLKGQLSKTRDADVSGSLDMSTSRDGENSCSSINSGESHDDDDDGYDDDVGRPPSSAMQLPIGPDPSSVDAARERSPSCRALLRRRRPRPPAVKGKECRMSVREFIGMLRSLETLDSRLTLREACRICAAVVSFVSMVNGRETPSAQRREDAGLSNRFKAEEQGQEDKEALLSIGDDSLSPEEFARVVFHCGDLKTWDGMCPVSQRIGLFVVHDLFERFLERTGEASVWWSRDGCQPHAY